MLSLGVLSNRSYLVCIYFRNFRRRVDYDGLVSDGGTRYVRGVYVYVWAHHRNIYYPLIECIIMWSQNNYATRELHIRRESLIVSKDVPSSKGKRNENKPEIIFYKRFTTVGVYYDRTWLVVPLASIFLTKFSLGETTVGSDAGSDSIIIIIIVVARRVSFECLEGRRPPWLSTTIIRDEKV